MFVDLNFIHFLATTIVLLILIVPRIAQHYKKVRKFDDSLSRPWGLVAYVTKDGKYISRVPSDQEKE